MKRYMHFFVVIFLLFSCNTVKKIDKGLNKVTLSALWPQSLMARFLTDGVAAIYMIEGLDEQTEVMIKKLQAKITNDESSGTIEINDIKGYIMKDLVVFDSIEIPPCRVLIGDSNTILIMCSYSYRLKDGSESRTKRIQSKFLLKNSELIQRSEFTYCEPNSF